MGLWVRGEVIASRESSRNFGFVECVVLLSSEREKERERERNGGEGRILIFTYDSVGFSPFILTLSSYWLLRFALPHLCVPSISFFSLLTIFARA